ncbi:MAG: hypothetical protein SLAVMIC_00133 [uncultured marine phage]|uniref:Uncharacterized protein n=1 Tax=uncultured marine phage TaxID=707152 RepID=A0A8D9FPZ4_9VIRU|nr:MAG: hypothetical protein SLAVMIC_00133 [uncultured marine phage]
MKMKKYQDFINESNDNDLVNESYDVFDDILNMPLEQRKEVKASLEEIADMKKNESMNEGLGDLYRAAVSRLKRWVSKKAVAFLINLSQNDLNKKIDMLSMLDPTDFSDINKAEVIYLGGGIDKTSEEGAAGWRDNIEEYFGMDHVVQGEDMILLAKDGKLNKGNYPKPLIMNPMRNELVRTNDPKFSEIFRKWKAGELNKETNPDEWKYWANVINKEIHAPDLRIVNACDTNLVKLDPAAGAGTLGEMQVSSLRGLNLFVWLDNGYQVQDISPWLIPTITKLVRSDEELQILLDNIKNINSGGKVKEPKSGVSIESDHEEFMDEVFQESSDLKRYNDFIQKDEDEKI